MAENERVHTHGVFTHARRRWGFAVFCALMAAIISVLVLSPVRPKEAIAAKGGRATGGQEPPAQDGPRERPGPRAGLGTPDLPSPRRISAALHRIAELGEPVYCGGGTRPLVALTFDDGPGPYTQETLSVLRDHGMTATFFLVGKLLGEGRFAWLPHSEAALGAVGDHTWDHVPVVGLSRSGLQDQIARTRQAVARDVDAAVSLFRPPLGQHDTAVDSYVRSLGMVEVLWSVDTQDSVGANADRIVRNVRRGLSPGDIVLLHENRGTTQLALPRILRIIRSRGYRTVTVPQLLARDPPSVHQLRTHTCPA
ncbi:MAG TPA: polysaccharide deacetylase family protein [Actinomycetota bacterium]